MTAPKVNLSSKYLEELVVQNIIHDETGNTVVTIKTDDLRIDGVRYTKFETIPIYLAVYLSELGINDLNDPRIPSFARNMFELLEINPVKCITILDDRVMLLGKTLLLSELIKPSGLTYMLGNLGDRTQHGNAIYKYILSRKIDTIDNYPKNVLVNNIYYGDMDLPLSVPYQLFILSGNIRTSIINCNYLVATGNITVVVNILSHNPETYINVSTLLSTNGIIRLTGNVISSEISAHEIHLNNVLFISENKNAKPIRLRCEKLYIDGIQCSRFKFMEKSEIEDIGERNYYIVPEGDVNLFKYATGMNQIADIGYVSGLEEVLSQEPFHNILPFHVQQEIVNESK